MATISKSKKARARVRAAAARRWGTIGNILGGLAFLNQATIKDKADISAQTTIQGKLKVIANSLLGHAVGINLFKDVPQKQQNFNPAGALNKWTYAGAAMTFLYSYIPKAPFKGRVKSVGKRLLIGGIAGGVIDDPSTSSAPAANNFQQPQRQFTGSNNWTNPESVI
jgi:hypothetical protein